MDLADLANLYKSLPERQRALREATEDAIAREVASRRHRVQDIAAALGITRQHVTRITNAAKARANR